MKTENIIIALIEYSHSVSELFMPFRKAPKSISASGRVQINSGDEIMTRQKLVPLFEDLKDFIRSTAMSTAKKTEDILRKEIRGVRSELKADIEITQQALKATKEELRGEMKGMESRLSDKIDKNNTRLDNHETRITTFEQRA
ncbi:MAG: hypothetical protein ABH871_02835 [Pseudomonadota bacterium]